MDDDIYFAKEYSGGSSISFLKDENGLNLHLVICFLLTSFTLLGLIHYARYDLENYENDLFLS